MSYINGPFDKIRVKLLPVYSENALSEVASLIWSLIYREVAPPIEKLLSLCDSKMPIQLKEVISKCIDNTCKLPDEIEQLYNINFYIFFTMLNAKHTVAFILNKYEY